MPVKQRAVVNLTVEQVRRIEAIAKEQDRTRSSVVRHLLESALDKVSICNTAEPTHSKME